MPSPIRSRWSPALGVLVVGLLALLAAIAAAVVADLPLPGSKGWYELAYAAWAGVLAAAGAGGAAIVWGMLGLARLDAAEAPMRPAPPVEPADTRSERVPAALLVAAVAWIGAVALGVATQVWPDRNGMVELWSAAGAMAAVGSLALALGVWWNRPGWQATSEPARPTRPAEVPHLHLGVLALLTVAAVGLQLTLVDWIVEDAAISFVYAKHMAAGHGPVTYIGGEHVEGYSNPLWTLLIAAFYLVGVDGFVSNKILAAVFAAITVPLTWAATREVRPNQIDGVPLVAAAILAGSAQFAIWGAGGLENSLLSVVMAGGIWRGLVEARRGGVPWSALFWLGVALTRPEGIMYAGIGGAWSMVFRATLAFPSLLAALRRADGAGVARALWAAAWPTLAWLALFFGPFALYQAWRMQTFAWEFPNTYYAKKGNPQKDFAPFEYSRKGWKYTREYAHKLWQGWLVPVYVLAMTGVRGWRAGMGVLAGLALAAVLLIPGPMVLQDLPWWDLREPSWWPIVRTWTFVSIGALAPVVVLGRPGWRALGLCWSLAVAAVFFAIYAGGDWMGGYRWFASLTVPAAIVLAVGFGELISIFRHVDRLPAAGGVVVTLAVAAWVPLTLMLASESSPEMAVLWPWKVDLRAPALGVAVATPILVAASWARSWRAPGGSWGSLSWPLAILLTGVVIVPHMQHLDLFIDKPTTSPWKVQKRVNYMNWVQTRMHLDEQPVNLDVDMGATMYWSGDRIVDIAGLVDVSMGHHWFERPFIRQYIYEERRPHFAHVHGGWANTSGIDKLPEWKEQYIEIDPYPTGKTSTHGGNHVRKDLLVIAEWRGTEGRKVNFETDLVLEGWESPTGVAPRGAHWYVEVAWSTSRPREVAEDHRAVLFLARGGAVVASWDVPPGYDWYKPHEWTPGEVVFGRYSLPIPADLADGAYDVGLAVFQAQSGIVVRATSSDSATPPPAFVLGEFLWPAAIEVTSADAAVRAAEDDLAAAVNAATAGRCQEAEDLRLLAIRRATRTRLDEEKVPKISRYLAACWGSIGAGSGPREVRVAAFERALLRDPAEASSRAAARRYADQLETEGMSAFSQKNWPVAYPLLRDALRVDPRRPWTRRHAEQARDCSLGIRLDQHNCGAVAPAILDQPTEAPEAAGDEEPPENVTPRSPLPIPQLPKLKRPIPPAPVREP